MWKRWNPNPQGLLTGDCTVRAICAATGKGWHEIHDQLCALSGRMADMPSADRVWWELLRRYGFTKQRLISTCPDCYTVRDFARDHPVGTFVLGPHEHAVCVINGDWWDSWDSGSTVPTYYFRRR